MTFPEISGVAFWLATDLFVCLTVSVIICTVLYLLVFSDFHGYVFGSASPYSIVSYFCRFERLVGNRVSIIFIFTVF